MERLIELFINTEDGEFYDRGGLLAAYDPAINAGELVRLTVQLCAGVPAFNSAGVLLNPDTTFAGTLAAAETIIDNNFNWYDKGTLLENLTTGTAISELSVASEASPRQLGAVRLNAGTVVNFCGWTATEGGYRLTLADNEFNPAQFTPAADFAQGAAVEVLEQPIIVSAQNDDSGRATGLFTGLLDASNPVYESMIEGQEDIPNCRIEFSIYQDGRAVFRARRYFDCLGAMAMNKGAAYVHSDSWREADSRYIKLVDWQAPPEYQFSEDGTTWHDQQQDADLYYHERRPGGQWGPAVKMKTGPTGAAAGFGTPTIAVETLPAGRDATASVTASGDDTAKVFNFNFGIPKGADGKAGADGADGVSSYTYVAYASDASGAGFSLTPTNALKFRAEIHTTTAIETPDADDFAGATWVKYIGDDGAGAGDMTKAVYDTNDDGIVDHAAIADAVGATTATQVADAVGKAHTHANKTTLDKLAEADGKLTYDGAEIGGGSGTVKSVNGQLPDESGNVTIETGGGMTARLVSGEVAASAGEWLVFTAAGSVTLPAGANLSEVKITAETAGVSVFPASGEAVAGDNGLSLDMPGYTVLLQFRETARNWVPVEITAARPSVLASSEEKPAIPDDGLVFYVPLESAEAATGQPISNNGVTFAPDAVLGRDVAVFDGSANLSFTPTGMPSGTAPHTKSLWIKFNGDTGQVYVLAWGSNGSDSASTITARNNKWAWCFAGDWEETDVDVPAGQWLNVTTTHSAGVNKLYVNGTLRNTHSRNLNISGNSGTIGSFLSGSEKITGTLAALRVYDRVLTADEIAALAAEFTI